VYATPGLPLATKQLLMVAFLGEAGMPDQLFGHALCALREGASASGLLAALDAGFQAARGVTPPSPSRAAAYEAGLAALEHAWAKARAEWEEEEGEGVGGGGGEEEAVVWEGRSFLPAGRVDLAAWGAA
jgi:hypothetical protein